MIRQYYVIDDEMYERINYEPCPKCGKNIRACDCNVQYQIDADPENNFYIIHVASDYDRLKGE